MLVDFFMNFPVFMELIASMVLVVCGGDIGVCCDDIVCGGVMVACVVVWHSVVGCGVVTWPFSCTAQLECRVGIFCSNFTFSTDLPTTHCGL
jgi:hypothetical protein